MKAAVCFSLLALILISAGCGQNTATEPLSSTAAALSNPGVAGGPSGPSDLAAQGKPGYEPAYYDDATVWINAIELPQHAPAEAQADLYEVVYPVGWEGLNVDPPQCNPCDHEGNGIDFTDYHDHVLDSIPRSPGHGEYSPLWHVYVVLPAYNQDAEHDAAVSAAYAAHLPIRSEDEVDAVLGETLADHSPVAVEVDTDFYFLCSVVNPRAAG